MTRYVAVALLMLNVVPSYACTIASPEYKPMTFLADLIPESKSVRLASAKLISVLPRVQEPGVACPNYIEFLFEVSVPRLKALTIKDYWFAVDLSKTNLVENHAFSPQQVTKARSDFAGSFSVLYLVSGASMPSAIRGSIRITPFSHANVAGPARTVFANMKLLPNKSIEPARER
jgi:hypothetical protein